MNRKWIEQRFHELAIKEATQTITQQEHAKLERYAALRRDRMTTGEIVLQEAQWWKIKALMKELGRVEWEQKGFRTPSRLDERGIHLNGSGRSNPKTLNQR